MLLSCPNPAREGSRDCAVPLALDGHRLLHLQLISLSFLPSPAGPGRPREKPPEMVVIRRALRARPPSMVLLSPRRSLG